MLIFKKNQNLFNQRNISNTIKNYQIKISMILGSSFSHIFVTKMQALPASFNEKI